MDGRALTRLRLAFLGLGLLLLGPLCMLLLEVEARLEEQRRLRHEIVAERIFDEMERELTALLEAERARPSSAYEAENTQAAAWAPFVVGYFTRDAHGLQVLARDQLPPERAARVERAAEARWRREAPKQRRKPAAGPLASEAPNVSRLDAKYDEKALAPELKREANQEAVLRQLNRAAAERLEKKSRSKEKLSPPSDDPLQGL